VIYLRLRSSTEPPYNSYYSLADDHMEIPVLVEPIAGKGSRFRAKTGEPWLASAEAATADEAVSQVQQMVRTRIAAGAKLLMMPVESDINPWLAMSGFLKDCPLADAWEQSMKEYRDEKDRLELVKE
jgi:hypothetical protein